MTDEIRFFVPGKPVPGGSKRAFVNKYTGKVAMIDMGVGNKDWRASIAHHASQVHDGPPLDEPLRVDMYFVMPRPKSHYRTGKRLQGVLRDDAPTMHTSKPDCDKLRRAATDALTLVVWKDDSLICRGEQSKTYGERPGVEIVVRRLES